MSIVEDLGAQVRAASDDLPLGQLAEALERFGLAAERLRWVRQESANPMGVPELSSAVEYAESAGYALRVAQEQLTAYLAMIGLAADDSPAPRTTPERRPAHDAPRGATPPETATVPPTPAAAPRWWAVRVAELTGGGSVSGEPDEAIADSNELLRRVVHEVRAGDRERLRVELGRAHADVGLGLAASAPPLLRELAGEFLGHPPRAEDLPRLRQALGSRTRDLLPGLPAPVVETLLARVCRMPPPRRDDPEQPHAADSAVTAGVLTGVLLDRLGRELPTPAERERRTDGARTRQAAVDDQRRAAANHDRQTDAEWGRRAAVIGQPAVSRPRPAAAGRRGGPLPADGRSGAPGTKRPSSRRDADG